MIEELRGHVEAMRGLVGEIEPAAVAPDDACRLLEVANAIERLGTGLKLAVTPRALAAAPWAEEGYRNEASWLAEQLRSSVPQAIRLKESAEALQHLPAIAGAASSGALSSTEVSALARAAAADPALEDDLLDAAGSLPVHELLRYAKGRAQASHQRDPEHRSSMSAKRYLNFWSDDEGLLRLSGAVLPEDGMDVVGAVRSMAQHLASEARRSGEQPPAENALAADALVALVRGDKRWATFDGPGAELAPRANLNMIVNVESLRRGEVCPGEECYVPGVGPVPLKVLESLLGDAHIKTVIMDGVDVRTVTHHGRAVPAHVETALEVRDPQCVVPGCRVELGLEIDHWQIPFAEGGPTALWNLCRLCKTHHRMKTYDGFVLSGGPGKWEWRPPALT